MSTAIESRGYAVADALVSTEWVAEHLSDPAVRVIESNEDLLLYPSGHIPGAVEVDWTRDLNDQVSRDYINADQFADLMSSIGVTPEMTVIFYGDRNNWWAAYALWVFSLFGHHNAKIMDGGRLKWISEGREITTSVPVYDRTTYTTMPRDDTSNRAFRDEVILHSRMRNVLIDVRSPEEFSGERLHMPDFPNEGALRGGHIPGAANVPWAKAINPEDGTFKSYDDLMKLYGDYGPDEDVVVYCRIGERSSHTWFVLKFLLGFPNVRNYDGSWTEWGNSVGLPIEK
jgi:thiosulfate/3-mercaptopyruvate sulfurtransferase